MLENTIYLCQIFIFMCCINEVGFIIVPQIGHGTLYFCGSGSPLVESSVLLISMDPLVCLRHYRRAFLQCGFACVSVSYQTERRTCHICCRGMVSLQYEPSCVSLGYQTQRKTCHIGCRGMASLRYVSSCVSLGHQTQKKTCHIGCRGMAPLRYESSCVY